MRKILHIVGSPRTDISASRDVSEAFISAVADRYPEAEIDVLDVWSAAIPEFDEEIMNAKYAHLSGTALKARQESAWAEIAPLAQRFRDADLLVIGVPMWNFGIPYRLKMLIDVVSQKDYLFRFDENGFRGMAGGKALLVCSRGINYATGSDTPEAEFDYQKSYMTMWLKFIGIQDVHTIVLEQLLFGSDIDAAARAEAKRAAAELAASI
jgi:Acyl carrier protein phosphodiesterase